MDCESLVNALVAHEGFRALRPTFELLEVNTLNGQADDAKTLLVLRNEAYVILLDASGQETHRWKRRTSPKVDAETIVRSMRTVVDERLTGKGGKDLLRWLLQHEDVATRTEGADLVLIRGLHGLDAESVVAALVVMLKHAKETPAMSLRATFALAKLARAADSAAPVLAAIVRNTDVGLRMRGAAASALGRLDPQSPVVIPTVRYALEQPKLALDGAIAAERLGVHAASLVPMLTEHLASEHVALRIYAAKALGAIGAAAKPALPVLHKMATLPARKWHDEGAAARAAITAIRAALK